MKFELRWAVSRTFAYERRPKLMLEMCKHSCTLFQATNRNITGCQFKWPTADSQNGLVHSAGYGDCLFFKGQAIEGDKMSGFSCLVFENDPTDYSIQKHYQKINPVDRKSGMIHLRGERRICWVLLRLPENEQMKTRVGQVRIEEDLSGSPGLKLEVPFYFILFYTKHCFQFWSNGMPMTDCLKTMKFFGRTCQTVSEYAIGRLHSFRFVCSNIHSCRQSNIALGQNCNIAQGKYCFPICIRLRPKWNSILLKGNIVILP